MKDNQNMPASDSAGALLQYETNPPRHILVVENDLSVRQLNSEVLLQGPPPKMVLPPGRRFVPTATILRSSTTACTVCSWPLVSPSSCSCRG
jgi:hypothetical protein